MLFSWLNRFTLMCCWWCYLGPQALKYSTLAILLARDEVSTCSHCFCYSLVCYSLYIYWKSAHNFWGLSHQPLKSVSQATYFPTGLNSLELERQQKNSLWILELCNHLKTSTVQLLHPFLFSSRLWNEKCLDFNLPQTTIAMFLCNILY